MLLTRLLGDPDIRQWLWEILDAGHAFGGPRRAAVGGYAADMLGDYIFFGEHRLAWWIWTQLDDASPELASQMRREHR